MTPANAGLFPATVPVSAGRTSTTFNYIDAGTVTNVTLGAILGESSATTSITTVRSTRAGWCLMRLIMTTSRDRHR